MQVYKARIRATGELVAIKVRRALGLTVFFKKTILTVTRFPPKYATGTTPRGL